MTTGLIIVMATAVVFGIIGSWYSLGKRFSVEEFISVRNRLGTWAGMATLVATGMGAWILFSPAEAGVVGGVTAILGYAVGSAGALFVFAFFGLKLRERMPQGHTLTEYVFHRYGKVMYVLVLAIMLFYMAVFLAAELTGIALAAKIVFGTPLIYTALIVGLATVVYTALGGLRASIFTDRIQAWIILPLIAVLSLTSLSILGGVEKVTGDIMSVSPGSLSFLRWPGIEYGLTLIIAIVGAELFNQANWQRVYASKSGRIMRKSFFGAGLVVFPIVLLMGLFGLYAISTGNAAEPSVAMFTVLLEVMPEWLLITAMVLGIVLVMSSMDSLLNGMVSLFTVEMVRLRPRLSQRRLMRAGQWTTVIIALLAMLVATEGLSVLYLFLVADLVCVAAAFPVVRGLYNKRISGGIATTATILGIAAGAAFFPDPAFSRGNLLISFAVAFLAPAVVSLALKGRKEFSFWTLKHNVTRLDK